MTWELINRKAVKAAIVLLPLLGITNVLVMVEAPLDGTALQFALWSYSSHFLTSFQGFFVALLYCFLNGEVKFSPICNCFTKPSKDGAGGYRFVSFKWSHRGRIEIKWIHWQVRTTLSKKLRNYLTDRRLGTSLLGSRGVSAYHSTQTETERDDHHEKHPRHLLRALREHQSHLNSDRTSNGPTVTTQVWNTSFFTRRRNKSTKFQDKNKQIASFKYSNFCRRRRLLFCIKFLPRFGRRSIYFRESPYRCPLMWFSYQTNISVHQFNSMFSHLKKLFWRNIGSWFFRLCIRLDVMITAEINCVSLQPPAKT